MKLIDDWNEYLKLHTNNKLKKVLIFLPVFFHNPGMFFSLLYRCENFLYSNKSLKILGYVFYPLYFFLTYYILDIDIHPNVNIGRGLYIHNKNIIIANHTIIGDYCKLIGPITIGINFKKTGTAILGNNIILSTGSRIIGPIKIGNNTLVGANAVVTKDFTDNLVLGGVPAKIIKNNEE